MTLATTRPSPHPRTPTGQLPAVRAAAEPERRVRAATVRAMADGIEEAEERGLGDAFDSRVVGGHVEVSLELFDALEWWRDLFGVSYEGSFVSWSPYGDARITGEYGDVPWVLKPVTTACNPDRACRRCAQLGTAPVRVNGGGDVVPTPRALEPYGHHRDDIAALYRQAAADLDDELGRIAAEFDAGLAQVTAGLDTAFHRIAVKAGLHPPLAAPLPIEADALDRTDELPVVTR